MKPSPCCRQCQLPSNCLWQMVVQGACQSLTGLKIHSDDNRSILKDTRRSQRLSLSARNHTMPARSGFRVHLTVWKGAFKEKNKRQTNKQKATGQAQKGCSEHCHGIRGIGGRKERRNSKVGRNTRSQRQAPFSPIFNLCKRVGLRKQDHKSEKPRYRRSKLPFHSWER